MSKRIDYNQNEKWTNGVEIPDGLITPNAADTYKLLEALNIDWENTNIPWATKIRKWNAAGVTPAGEFSDYKDSIDNANLSDNPLNNTIDWINSKYDYLSDMDEQPSGDTDVLTLKPRWSEEGTIKDSTDIVDLLNYLTWRVVTIDYYTDHWDRRNSRASDYIELIYPDNDTASTPFTDDAQKSPLGYDESTGQYKFYKADYGIKSGNRAKVILTPTTTRSPYYLNKSNDIVYNYYKNLSLDNHILSIVASNNPGEMTVISNTIDNTAIINSIDRLNIDSIEMGGESWKFFTIDMDVIGTGNYKPIETWYNDIKSSITNLSNFDPFQKFIDFTINHAGESDSATGQSFTGTEIQIHLTIEKTNNTVSSVKFGNVEVISGEASDLAISTTKIGKIYTNANEIAMPYYINDESSKKEITFNLQYGQEYGIYPYFFIANDSNYTLNGREFSKCESPEYGKIVYENNKYYYIPPIQTTNSDKEFNIYCIFYYKDDNVSRQITPTIVSFKVKLKKEVENHIYFLDANSRNMSLYRRMPNGTYDFGNGVEYGTDWVKGDDSEHGNYYNNVTSNNINYCVRTISYGDYINSIATGGKQSPGPQTAIIFDDFIRTYCGSEFSVEYLGLIESDTSERSILIDETNDSGRVDVNSEITDLEVLLNNKIKVGENSDKSFYYVNDNVEKYYNISVLNNITSASKPSENSHLNTNEFSINANNKDSYLIPTEELTRDFGKQKVFNILSSTAMYGDKNGIFNLGTLESPQWVNADSDYFYLVFKIKSESGSIGSISYTPCKAYYFLKVLRQERQYNLLLSNDLDSAINYTLITGNETEIPCSFSLVPRIPIYLNRLLNLESQIELMGNDGKIYWDFYGVGDPDISSRWDDTKVAIENKNTNEQFIAIYNEGDTYKTIAYNSDNGKQNNNYLFKPENDVIIPKNFTGNTGTATVAKFSNAASGSILFVNKLLCQTQYDETNDTYEYGVIPNDSISLALTCSIGNSSRYTRNNNSNTTFNVKINKKTLDIDLYEAVDTNSPRKVNYIVNPKVLTKTNSNTINTGSSTGLISERWSIQFISNEFGTGTTQGVDTLAAYATDALKIELYNGLTSIKAQNSFIDTYLNVSINSLYMNNNWFINTSGETQQATLDKENKFFNLYYFTKLDTSNNVGQKYSLNVIGVNDTQNQKYQMNVTVDGDPDGVYKRKDIIIYIKVEEQSSGDVQTGD